MCVCAVIHYAYRRYWLIAQPLCERILCSCPVYAIISMACKLNIGIVFCMSAVSQFSAIIQHAIK